MRRIVLAVAMAVVGLVPAAAQENEVLFTLAQENPVIAHGSGQDFDSTFTDPGAVLVHDGVFHMFRNGFKAWPATVQIAHHVSDDGVNWTMVGESPVLYTDDVPYAEVAALASGAVVTEDGTWMLYFYTWETRVGPATGRIGLATADNPDGPWTVLPEPVLEPGPEGAWDSLRVDAPRVFATDDGYVMFYTGNGAEAGKSAIGRATSPDGIVWTKFDDPATTDALYAESDPVFVSPVEGFIAHQPAPVQTDDGWIMIYRRQPVPPVRLGMSLHAATSEDGISWTPVDDTVLWDGRSYRASSGFWYTAAAHHEGTTYLYIEIGKGPYTDIYATTYTGSFTP